jgi:glycosyltransferase involved in cell wall biosynthesis
MGASVQGVSVVIPSRDRHALLADCLDTLGAQGVPRRDWEVIVVDDGSDEPLEPVVERAATAGLPVRCVRQPKAGLNAARNRGAAESRGSIVAFLDDDTLVEPGWAPAVRRAFERHRCEALGGRVVLRPEGHVELPRWLTEKRLTYLSRYDLGDTAREIHGPPLPVGANFAIRRATLERLGGFRAGLDRIGGELISNGEFELLRRLLRAGGQVLYWPHAEVVHRVPAERLTKAWFRRRAHAQGVSDARTDPLDGVPYALRVSREAVRAGRALPIFTRRFVEGRGGFDAELWLIACRARIAELGRQRAANV